MLRSKTMTILFQITLSICLAIALVIAQAGCAASDSLESFSQISFAERKDAFSNPLIGFAASADNPEAVGDNSLVFILVTWQDWEPKKGQYNADGLEQKFNLEQWRNSGKRVVLRFVCDVPGEESHKDIPEWLYEEMKGDGSWYDISSGKGFSPNYENAYFIERHRQAIEAFGDYYGQDSFIAYVELGSLGHWGEWHTDAEEGIARIPNEDICSQYVEPYLTAFPNAKLLMRRPFSWVSEHQLGVFNDMTGSVVDTQEWLGWINDGGTFEESAIPQKLKAVPRVWMTSPIGGEFTSSVPMEQMLEEDLDTTLSLIKESHMSFIGPKIPLASADVSEESIDAVVQSLGYRYTILESNVSEAESGKKLVSLDWKNSGSAPIYWNWSAYLYVLDDDNNILHKQQIDMDLTTLSGGETQTTETVVDSESLSSGNYRVGIGIEDPQTGNPAVTLAMECETVEKIHIVGWFTQ